MKILLFTQYFWPENFYINHIALTLKKNRHDVEVLTGQPNYPDGKILKNYSSFNFSCEKWKGIKIHRIPILSRGMNNPFRLAINYLSFIISGTIFAPFLLRSKNFDVIFVYAPSPILQVIPAIFLGWLKQIPIILWVQDLWPESMSATGVVKSRFLLLLTKFLVKFCYVKTDLILVQSKAFIPHIKNYGLKINSFYYPNSVSDDFYSPINFNIPNIKSLEGGFSILFAGNVGNGQAMEVIVSAAEKLIPYKEIKFVILGSGCKIDWITNEIDKKKLVNIFLEGNHPIEHMPLLMRKASALLVCLNNQPIFDLTIPSKVQAYLAVGRPIIGSLNGEAAKLIRDAKAGFIAPAENVDKLVEIILKMYYMKSAKRNQFGKNGRRYFKEHFDTKVLTEQLIEYFEAAINQKGKR